jgi:hypothetical protein
VAILSELLHARTVALVWRQACRQINETVEEVAMDTVTLVATMEVGLDAF